MSGFPGEPACWSWSLPTVLSREQEVDRLEEESLRQAVKLGSMDHYLPPSACRMLTRDWPAYLLNSWHDDRCALCGIRPGHLVLDHEYSTGLVRGRLCGGCKVSEGKRFAEQDPVYQMYRERHPALILGLRIYYVGRGWAEGWWNDVDTARMLTGNPKKSGDSVTRTREERNRG